MKTLYVAVVDVVVKNIYENIYSYFFEKSSL